MMSGRATSSKSLRRSTGDRTRLTTYVVQEDGSSYLPVLPDGTDDIAKLVRCRIEFVPPAAGPGSACIGSAPIALAWDALRHVGSEAQKLRLNRLRIAYISSMVDVVQEECDSLGCRIEAVGTDYRNATVASDADLNFRFDRTAANWTETLLKLYDRLYTFHYEHLPGASMSATFDLNVYASEFALPAKVACDNADDRECLRSSCSQRVWAALRLVEALERNGGDGLTAGFEKVAGTEFVTDVLGPARARLRALRSSRAAPVRSLWHLSSHAHSNEYARRVARAFVAAEAGDDDDALERFSESKFDEHDTYRSAGAFLHIVGGIRGLHPYMYLDSALDNLGFLVENLLERKAANGCVEVPLDVRLARVAKYLERTCDALLIFWKHINTQNTYTNIQQQPPSRRPSTASHSPTHTCNGFSPDGPCLIAIKNACAAINLARKSAVTDDPDDPEPAKERLKKLRMLLVPDNIWNSTDYDNLGDEGRWLAAVAYPFLRSWPYAKLCRRPPGPRERVHSTQARP